MGDEAAIQHAVAREVDPLRGEIRSLRALLQSTLQQSQQQQQFQAPGATAIPAPMATTQQQQSFRLGTLSMLGASGNGSTTAVMPSTSYQLQQNRMMPMVLVLLVG